MKAQLYGDDIYINCNGELVFFGTYQPTVVLIERTARPMTRFIWIVIC
jgi:hypothetical protein